jgi:hypothetical protein
MSPQMSNITIDVSVKIQKFVKIFLDNFLSISDSMTVSDLKGHRYVVLYSNENDIGRPGERDIMVSYGKIS